MKKRVVLFITIILLFVVLIPNFAFAEEAVDTYNSRYYNVTEEVVADRLDNVYLYPSDAYYGCPNAENALKRVYVDYERHYKVYRVKVGDPDNRVFLYHKYVCRWKGQWRLATSTDVWHDDPMYPLEERTSIERQPWLDLFEGYGLDS